MSPERDPCTLLCPPLRLQSRVQPQTGVCGSSLLSHRLHSLIWGNQETLIHTTETVVSPVWSSRLPLQPFIAFHLLYKTVVIPRADSRECVPAP